MFDLKKFEQEIINKYPETTRFKSKKYHLNIPIEISIEDDVIININFKKYPKLPKTKLVRSDGKTFKLDLIISSLRDWEKKKPPSILEVIEETIVELESIVSNIILIKKDFITVLMEMCKNCHPKKVTGILGVEKGIVSEYILPSRACTNINKNKEVWGVTSCAIPLNFSYQGTFISRPEGDLSKNDKMKEVLKRRRFTLLFGFPYKDITCFRCFDTEGNTLELSIVE